MKKRKMLPVLSTLLLASMVCSPSAFASGVNAKVATTVGVQYKTHIQDKGWETNFKTGGNLSGTVGEGKRLEGLIVQLVGSYPADANIQTYVHVQNEGDLGPFAMGKNAGTEGKGLRMERISLVLNDLPGYRLRYNVQVENKGWLRDENDSSKWFSSGETAGTTGQSLRLEGIRIKLVEVNEEYETYLATLAAAPESYYTTASWAIYKKVLDDNVVTEADTKAVITAATANIIAAQKNLVKGKNLASYNAALAAAQEVEYTPATWTEYYYGVVLKNVVDQSNSQAEINTATANILAAQKKLQRKVDLTKYKETLAAVRVEDYTTSSWNDYQKVLAANAMTEDNTQTEIETAIKIIDEAQKQMVRKFDFTAYNALINSVKSTDYVASSWAVYQAVVDNNPVTENDTQTIIETAIKTIEVAQQKLVKAADLTYYNAAINAVKKEDYTTVSWNAYQKEIQAIIVNKTSKPEVVEAAINKILEAQLKLVDKGSLVDYNAAIAYAAGRKALYTTATWATYQKVVDANIVYATDGQPVIDAATNKIEEAQKKLVLGGDISAYTALLATKNEDNYTLPSWTAYQKIVKANAMTKDKPQTTIDAAVEVIRAAQANLVPKGILTDYNSTLKLVSENDWTNASWTIYKKTLSTLEMTSNNSQAEIKVAVEKIIIAQSKLVKKGDLAKYIPVFTKFDGKEYAYTTASWTYYQGILNKNTMTTESKQSDIDNAVFVIEQAQKKLIDAPLADLKAYNEAIAVYAGRQAEFTSISWSNYQGVIAKYPATKDSTVTAIRSATAKILEAQLQLESAANLDPFLEAIKLYQEDKIQGGKYSAHVKTNWDVYAKLVEQYASFDANWTWKSAGTKLGDVTQATPAKDVEGVTTALNNAKKSFVFIDQIATAYAAYDAAISYPGGHTPSFYTVTSVTLFEMQKTLNAIPERVKADLVEIQAKTGNMQTAQSKLVERASETTVAAFNAEVTDFSNKFKDDMTVDSDLKYIWDQCHYTEDSWTAYETVKRKYVDISVSMLKPDDNTEAEYLAAIADMQAKEAALVYTAKYVGQDVIPNDFIVNKKVISNANLVTLANTLISGKGFTATIVDLGGANANTNVDATGKVIGAPGTTVVITLNVVQNTDPANVWQETLQFTVQTP